MPALSPVAQRIPSSTASSGPRWRRAGLLARRIIPIRCAPQAGHEPLSGHVRSGLGLARVPQAPVQTVRDATFVPSRSSRFQCRPGQASPYVVSSGGRASLREATPPLPSCAASRRISSRTWRHLGRPTALGPVYIAIALCYLLLILGVVFSVAASDLVQPRKRKTSPGGRHAAS